MNTPFYFLFSFLFQGSLYTESSQPCSNQCCKESPCAHGGTCTELCDHAKHKFNCTCSKGYYGKLCEKKRATLCKEKLSTNRRYPSGVYYLFDHKTSSSYKAYCDFTSEDGFVWTIVESFSLANNNMFTNKSFHKDYPVSQNAFTWEKYRLSFSRMTETARHSTHVRATCNFNTETGPLNYTDYLRAKLSDIDVMKSEGINDCKRYEYINIRGHGCSNCTAWFSQSDSVHAHVASYHGLSCIIPGADDSQTMEDYFGFYQTTNHVHRCSSSGKSTTQWWFGEQH